jgi:uncharacterized protein
MINRLYLKDKYLRIICIFASLKTRNGSKFMSVDIVLIIIGFILIIVGIIGSIVPALPGPPLAYISLILLQFTSLQPYSILFLVIVGLLVVVITVFDFLVPIWGTKKFGGTKGGKWGSAIGIFLGLFFWFPVGIIAFPFLGAFLGELIVIKRAKPALRAAFGSFLGFLTGVFMKLMFCFAILGVYIWSLW